MSSTGGRPPVGLHIDLPPPDLSQFKAPGDGPAQPPGPAQAQGQAGPSAAPAPPPQQGPLFTSEVKEMFYYIRGAALKAAEIVRYQTDMKQLQRVNGQVAPVPNRLLGAFRQDTERLDQVCDVMEAQILRLISVLVREINRQKARAAEEAAAKATLEREQAAAAAAAAAASMASSDEAVKPETVKTEAMDLDTQSNGGQPSDTTKTPPSSEPNSSLAPPRVSSTAPSVVSLSNLPSSSADLGEAAATEQATKARLARGFTLKLDLPSPNLRGSFTGLVPNSAAPDPPGSPVRIAPKSAKPRPDDPTASAFGLMGPPQFNPALMQQLAAQPPPSAFVQNSAMPFSGVADPSDTNALIPDILRAAAQQASAAATQPDASLQAFSAGDVIDLTVNSPIRGHVNMPINVDAEGPTETIDLTMEDSPTIPLSQFVASKKAEGGLGDEESGSMTGIEVPAVTEGGAKVENTTTEAKQANETSAGPAPDASLEGLVSSLTGAAGEARPTNGDATTVATADLPADATSLLATLTAAAQTSSNDNTTNGAGASNDANTNPFQGLIPPGDFGDLSSIGLGGGDIGMDLSAMGMDMGMYLPSADGTSGAGLGDAATAGMFEGFGGLMGDGGADAAGAGMDFDNMLGDMSIFAGMGGTGGDGSNTQNN
ncbi:hypothetical protein FS837_007780 [Tulasnella sp. UAMH 9824]|nr:hypothetical protein FS837_007780 [Tulasnella sp. UAMH 9824]